jgi:hypothetical protein
MLQSACKRRDHLILPRKLVAIVAELLFGLRGSTLSGKQRPHAQDGPTAGADVDARRSFVRM